MNEYLNLLDRISLFTLFDGYKTATETYLYEPTKKNFDKMEKRLISLFFKTKIKRKGIKAIEKEMKTEQELLPLYNDLIGITS